MTLSHMLVVFLAIYTAASTTVSLPAQISPYNFALPSSRWGASSVFAVRRHTTQSKVSRLQVNSQGARTNPFLHEHIRSYRCMMCASPLTPDESADTGQKDANDANRDRQYSTKDSDAGAAFAQERCQGSVQPTWGNGEVFAGFALFLLLHSIGLNAVQLATPESEGVTFAVAFSRVLSTALFIVVQQSAGLPIADLLTLRTAADPTPERANIGFLQGALAPAWGILLFSAAAFLPSVVQAIVEQRSVEDVLMPYAREIPAAGRAFDIVAAAPLTEELFFRGWLLAAMERRGASATASVGLSAASFALWHASGAATPADALFFLGFGAWLALLHRRSQSLLTPIIVHCAWNTGFMLLRWQLSLAAV
uniref:CAAX prenyl protease 2/Lysostaphin resistance protein A-like domain-containing protein n=1 Tax=Chrysotila carterae TaxID=13221 RepID=A0A7S4B5Z9_CHRCT